MKYSVEGGNLPVLICELEDGEGLVSESGGRSWARGNVQTDTTSGGGALKMLGRLVSGESLFLSQYTARGHAEVAFASSFPGSIVPIELVAGQSIIVQKKAFMAATAGIGISMHFQKKLGAGFFGGEGFVMQKISGPGIAFLEIDGHATTYELASGEEIICDTGILAMMDETCKMDIRTVQGLKNMAFGGEGIFDTVVTGPGRVVLQSMPISKFASLFVSSAK